MKNSHIVTLILSLVFISMASSEAGAQEITVPEGYEYVPGAEST